MKPQEKGGYLWYSKTTVNAPQKPIENQSWLEIPDAVSNIFYSAQNSGIIPMILDINFKSEII